MYVKHADMYMIQKKAIRIPASSQELHLLICPKIGFALFAE